MSYASMAKQGRTMNVNITNINTTSRSNNSNCNKNAKTQNLNDNKRRESTPTHEMMRKPETITKIKIEPMAEHHNQGKSIARIGGGGTMLGALISLLDDESDIDINDNDNFDNMYTSVQKK